MKELKVVVQLVQQLLTMYQLNHVENPGAADAQHGAAYDRCCVLDVVAIITQ